MRDPSKRMPIQRRGCQLTASSLYRMKTISLFENDFFAKNKSLLKQHRSCSSKQTKKHRDNHNIDNNLCGFTRHESPSQNKHSIVILHGFLMLDKTILHETVASIDKFCSS